MVFGLRLCSTRSTRSSGGDYTSLLTAWDADDVGLPISRLAILAERGSSRAMYDGIGRILARSSWP